MVMIELPLTEEMAQRARAAGLLEGAALTALIAAELERQKTARREAAIARSRGIMAKLDAIEPPLTQEEIDEELRAVKQERRLSMR